MIKNKMEKGNLNIDVTVGLQEQLEQFCSDYGTDKEYIVTKALNNYFQSVNN
jgi:D-hexose-6-phosphate mutarotase